MNLITTLVLVYFCLRAYSVKYSNFFYDKTGILNIDGSVPGQSEPITLDMKAPRFVCAKRQYFIFTFCPDVSMLMGENETRCEEGIAFCYEPILTAEFVREKFILHTQPDLEVSKKCGDYFRGFNVALKSLYNEYNEKGYFYEIQTGYQEAPYYFAIPTTYRITLWLGNEADLTTVVRTVDKKPLYPQKVRQKEDGPLVGETNESYTGAWLDTVNMARFENEPSIRMLYLDLKSREFVPQMMFTVGPTSECNLLARVTSNNVGKCMSRFTQKSMSIRPYGNLTSFTLTIVSGVDTNDTQGSKTLQQKVLDKVYEQGQGEEDVQEQSDEGIQSYNENYQAGKPEVLANTHSDKKEEKDVTGFWKKIGQEVINTASKIGCLAFTIITDGFGGCKSKVEFKDIQTTTFHEAFTQTRVVNTKTSVASNSVHSVQSVLQTVFTQSRGRTESTTHSEERSMSNAVSTRTVFQWTIEIPAGKVMTPMQMAVDCDGNSVKIPWMKFKLLDEKDVIMDEYDVDNIDYDNQSPVKTKDKSVEKEEDYAQAAELISEQEKKSNKVFNSHAVQEKYDYSDWNFDDGPPTPPPPPEKNILDNF